MLKKSLILLIVMAVLVNTVPVMAQEEAASVSVHTEEELEKEKIELSLEDAIELALNESPRIKAADASIKSAHLSLEVSRDTTKDYKDMEKLASKIPGVSMAVNVSSGLDQAYLKHGYYLNAAQVGVDLAGVAKGQVEATISYEVTQKYYNAKLMEELIAITEASVKLAKDNLALMEHSFEAGFVPSIEVQNAKNAVVRAEYSLESYKRNHALAVRSLKVSLQLTDSDCELLLTDKVELPSLPENVPVLIEGALSSRYDMTAVRKDYELKKEKYDITAMYMSDKTALYHSAYSEYLNAEYTYNNTIEMMKIALESEYATILNGADEIKACENDVDVAEALYESKKTMYDLGLITNLELTAAMTELETAKVKLENARVNYALSVIKFAYSTTIGI